jgi:hypothetical protein
MAELADFTAAQDVMQVCRNGHVITDLLRSYPERGLFHCDRCGAQTLDHCLTCGQSIPGALYVPGLSPAGSSPPPNYCVICGAAYPWTTRPRLPAPNARAQLEHLLRRLPQIARQLRCRQTDRPPFRIEDERDLEDLLRSLLPLHFDDIRAEGRTPHYSARNRTDFVLGEHSIAVAVKLVLRNVRQPEITKQLEEDLAYYVRQACKTLMVLIYDPEGELRDPATLENAWSGVHDGLEVRCIIGTP